MFIFFHFIFILLFFLALFHNNCFYLAHHLLFLVNKYKEKLRIPSEEFSMIYVDQILLLRQIGSAYFLNHMKFQRDIIYEILRDSGMLKHVYKTKIFILKLWHVDLSDNTDFL